MQTALPLRRFSINSIVAMFALVLALAAGALGGYWLKSQVTTAGVTRAAQTAVSGASQQSAPPHDMPEAVPTGQAPPHDMPEEP